MSAPFHRRFVVGEAGWKIACGAIGNQELATVGPGEAAEQLRNNWKESLGLSG